jgi:PASTA domain/Divergent InlB B-repeat domain
LLLTESAGVWAPGVEASLPANAAKTNLFVSLTSVSCASAGNCTAVGDYLDNSPNDNGEGLLLTETAGTWSTGVEAVLPSNATSINQSVNLSSVSCGAAGNCAAVGYYLGTGGDNHGLILDQTAGNWSAGFEPPLPANTAAAHGALIPSVSCVSAGNCTAVGVYVDSSGAGQGLLLTETAGTWETGVEATLPSNANADPNATFTAVSCTSLGNCTAVGSYNDDSGAQRALLSTETGGSWTRGVEGSLPANASNSVPIVVLPSVSCASAGNCAAVGNYRDESGNCWGLLLSESAGTWAAGVKAPLPANAATSQQCAEIISVSCPSAGMCEAVGGYNDSSLSGQGVLLTETAGNWATGVEASLPSNAGGNPLAGLTSVSCPSTQNCSGLGSYGTNSNGQQGVFYAASTTPPKQTLTVSKGGAGSGLVASSPSGINCGSACSHQFTQGTNVTLTATATAGSAFVGWSGACTGSGACDVTLNQDATVTATFKLTPKKPCVVPKVKGKTLKAAKRLIKAHACTVGKVKRATSRTVKKNHVISQKPKPGKHLKHGAKVSLTVSKGR